MNRKIFNRASCASSVLTGLMDGNAVSAKAVGSAIKTIATAGAKLDTQIHATAVACIHLSMPQAEGGSLNANSARMLLNAMPKGSRAKALAAWFEAYSNIVPKRDADGQWTCNLHGPASKMYKQADPEAAMAKPFWSVDEKDIDPKAFTLGAALASIIKRAEKQDKEGKLSAADSAFMGELRKLQEKAAKAAVKEGQDA